MIRKLLAAAAASAAVVGLTCAPAGAAETTLTVDDIVLDSHSVAAQSIHIGGNTDQAITVEFPDGAPNFYEAPFRYGQQACVQQTATRYLCNGTSESIYISYRIPLDMENSRTFTVAATATDGAHATGTVAVHVLTDVRVVPNFTRWQTGNSASTTAPAKLIVAEHNLGLALAHDLVLRLSPLDASLGLPAGCRTVGGGTVECARPNLPMSPELVVRSLEFTIPFCQVYRSVTITISASTQTDPDPANNTLVMEAIPTYGSPICSGGPGDGGSGGVGGGGAAQGGGTASATAGPSSTVDPSTAPTVAADGQPTARIWRQAPVGLPRTVDPGLTWLWIMLGVGAPVALVLGALGGWWWRRRTTATPGS